MFKYPAPLADLIDRANCKVRAPLSPFVPLSETSPRTASRMCDDRERPVVSSGIAINTPAVDTVDLWVRAGWIDIQGRHEVHQ